MPDDPKPIEPSDLPPSDRKLANELDATKKDLAAETVARIKLEGEVAQLKTQLASRESEVDEDDESS